MQAYVCWRAQTGSSGATMVSHRWGLSQRVHGRRSGGRQAGAGRLLRERLATELEFDHVLLAHGRPISTTVARRCAPSSKSSSAAPASRTPPSGKRNDWPPPRL